jgi:integrase
MPKECCEQYPSAGTRRALLRVRRAALQHAVNEDELVSRNVARQVKMPARDERRTREWAAEEAARFLDEALKDRLYALWAVALSLGLRRGEALGLRWADVDFVRGRLDVAQALHHVDGQDDLSKAQDRFVGELGAAHSGDGSASSSEPA